MIYNLPKLFFVIICTLSTFFALFPSRALASNFTTKYQVNYNVTESGVTQAKLDIVLKNNTDQYFASSYKLLLGFENISNIKATDSSGAIKTLVKKTNDGHEVDLQFKRKSPGLGAEQRFIVTFDTKSVASKAGNIWEIYIPGIANPQDFNEFTVTVGVPESFGIPSYIKPSQSTDELSFNKEQLGKSGISIAFGEKQIFDFKLDYHLRNPNLFPIRTEIAIPMDTNYQEVIISDIKPRPTNVVVDKDGNWLAQYTLKAASQMDVMVKGKAKIDLNPKETSITESEKAEYIKPTENWQTENGEIKKLAKQLKTPEAIYQYVVTTLNYDFTRVTGDLPRLGGVKALSNPDSAVCREFTDLFISIARAAGIPAREVDGFAYTQNSKQRPLSRVEDILHAWPEYYDDEKKTWVMVDPTWGSTTGGVDYFNVLDFDHFAFIIRGRNDSYPIPAGGYKSSAEKNLKDVTITFGDTFDNDQSLKIDSVPQRANIAGFPVTAKVKLTNTGGSSINGQTMNINSDTLSPADQALIVPVVPPFGYVNLNLNFDRSSFLTNGDQAFTIQLGDVKSEQEVKVSPFYKTTLGIGGVLFAVFTAFLFIAATTGRRLQIFRQKK